MPISLLNLGARALTANQGELGTIAHNIANANTAGYSRQEAALVTADGQLTGAGFFGRGVDIGTVQRRYDVFLAASVRTATSQSASDSARSSALADLDGVFSDSALGVGASLDQLFAATGDLANRPADLATRQSFLAAAGSLAQRVTSVGSQLSDLSSRVDSQLQQTASQVNDRLTTIRTLNDQIARLSVSGQPPNDLLDKRDAAVQSLGELMSVQVVAADDGSLNLFTANGAALLVGTHQASLTTQPDATDPTRLALRLDQAGGVSQTLDAADLGGGSLAGLMLFRDQDLAAARSQLGALAQRIADAFNTQHAQGVDANGNAGGPLFDVQLDATGRVTGLSACALSPLEVATGAVGSASARADNRNALALGALADLRGVDGSTMNQAYANLLADVGNRVQGARQLADASGAMKSEAVSRQQATSGVNLDEEAANLLRYQQAYQASAKIIQASQTLFDTLLSAAGR